MTTTQAQLPTCSMCGNQEPEDTAHRAYSGCCNKRIEFRSAPVGAEPTEAAKPRTTVRMVDHSSHNATATYCYTCHKAR